MSYYLLQHVVYGDHVLSNNVIDTLPFYTSVLSTLKSSTEPTTMYVDPKSLKVYDKKSSTQITEFKVIATFPEKPTPATIKQTYPELLI